jgi:ComF family protein
MGTSTESKLRIQLKEWLKVISELIYPEPPVCIVCKTAITTRAHIPMELAKSNLSGKVCNACFGKLEFILDSYCTVCGRSIRCDDAESQFCQDCSSDNQRYFVSNRAAVAYNEAIQDIIHRLKYRGQRELADLLAAIAHNAFKYYYQDIHIDIIIPVPLHVDRLAERGFNQAAMIGNKLAADLQIPIDTTSLQRVLHTPKQSKKTRWDRIQPLDGVFVYRDQQSDQQREQQTNQLESPLSNKSVLLLDDIYTTGTTVDACAKVLKAAGAANVYVLTLAR